MKEDVIDFGYPEIRKNFIEALLAGESVVRLDMVPGLKKEVNDYIPGKRKIATLLIFFDEDSFSRKFLNTAGLSPLTIFWHFEGGLWN